MSALEQAFPESIDEILAVVKETPRGRWFLEGYEKRLRTTETERILTSISKLESHVQNLSSTGQDGALLQKAREAIAAARRDIAAIEQKPAELSAEGQLFAKLAALSKQSFSGQPAVSKGVERALRLVSDLDQQLTPAGTLIPAGAPAAGTDFFRPDDAIFEPAPAPQTAVSAKRNENAEVMPRGAKLVIQHKAAQPPAEAEVLKSEPSKMPAPTQEMTKAAISPQPNAMATPPFAAVNPAPAEPAAEVQHSRIVIIRRKAEELESLPLLEPSADATVSAA